LRKLPGRVSGWFLLINSVHLAKSSEYSHVSNFEQPTERERAIMTEH